ncbi:hypothetical protein BG006_007047 [Podila minutissima]|uniref:Uncharacterized protein n=1 Tax=Podila minutissima TaxID=64525 RepID=A0A9P5VKM3_9FUNG|nr:hypothetical protein BG006_007047 [Podila minutissima]
MSSSVATSSASTMPSRTTSTVPSNMGSTSTVLSPSPTLTIPNNTTFSFKPPPTDNDNHCKCGPQESCFMYPGGFICQPFTSNKISDAPGVPLSWFLTNNYPSVRYTRPVANQTAGANCTTITTPPPRYYQDLAYHIMKYDMGRFIQDLDSDYSSTLFQYRGNCADAFYCRPNNLPKSVPGFVSDNIQGNLPGTCQPLVAEGGDCVASSMCQGWHVSSSFTYNNDQFRCKMTTKMGSANHPAGTCHKLGVGSGTVDFSNNGLSQRTARTYILSTMLIFSLAFLYMWYRRQKRRHMQQRMIMDAEGQPYYYDNTGAYLHRGGVNRQPDENDGELPAYGQHRRDQRVTGPAAEEIGMYSFSNGAPPPAGPNPAYPAASIRPTQHTYPFSMNHPALANPASPVPNGPLYPPPQSPPPPSMSASEAEAAALSAAAAAVETPFSAQQAPVEDSRRVVAEGGLLPPSYDSFAPGSTGGEKEKPNGKVKEEDEEGTNPFEGSSAGSSRSTPDLKRSKEKADQGDHDSTRSGGSSSGGPDSGRN